MRKVILFALLATAAVPAVAGSGRGGGGMGFGGGAMRASSSFGGSGERSMRASSNFDRPMRAERSARMSESGRDSFAAPQFARPSRQAMPAMEAREQFAARPYDGGSIGLRGRAQTAEPMRDWWAQAPRSVTVAPASNWTGAQPSHTGQVAAAPRQWRTDWRSSQQYDWQRYRDSHRSVFRLGSYFDPYGYGYRRFSIGFNLWPSYYGSNYWLSDPWMYRLPPAPPGTRWVRYYNDALLVDMYTGRLVDVIYNFFW